MWTSTTRTRSSLRAVLQDVMMPGTMGTSLGKPTGREVPKSNSRNTSIVARVNTITAHRMTSNQRLAIISQPPRKDLMSYYLSRATVQGGVARTGTSSCLAVDGTSWADRRGYECTTRGHNYQLTLKKIQVRTTLDDNVRQGAPPGVRPKLSRHRIDFSC